MRYIDEKGGDNYDEYDIYIISESCISPYDNERGHFQAEITKTVIRGNNAISSKTYNARLYYDDCGKIYTSRKSRKIIFEF